ncbi:MAG: ribosome-associated translation inhibitor RaiA [Rhodocyclaceae bacterium]
MSVPLQITVREFPHSEALDAAIREKVEKLAEFYPHIMGCRVVVEIPHKHKHQGRFFNVRLDITVPGSELVINRDLHEDPNVALRDAFGAARRRLEDFGRVQRGDVKAHAPAERGRIVRLDAEAGFGFIETAGERELYFSRDNVIQPDFAELTVGTEVQFIEEAGAEGFQAKRVSARRPGG